MARLEEMKGWKVVHLVFRVPPWMPRIEKEYSALMARYMSITPRNGLVWKLERRVLGTMLL